MVEERVRDREACYHAGKEKMLGFSENSVRDAGK